MIPISWMKYHTALSELDQLFLFVWLHFSNDFLFDKTKHLNQAPNITQINLNK